MTKLRIDLASGIIEVEGEETFVREIYDEYKSQLQFKTDPNEQKISKYNEHAIELPKEAVKKGNSKTMRRVRQNSAPTFVKNLDLSSKDGKSLREFYQEKSPSNAMESNAVFVYHLQKVAQLSEININHIFTCYKDVGARVPEALKQSLVDTASRKGWLDTSSIDNIRMSTRGENFVEIDLTRKGQKKIE